jgi:hypothetical protein
VLENGAREAAAAHKRDLAATEQRVSSRETHATEAAAAHVEALSNARAAHADVHARLEAALAAAAEGRPEDHVGIQDARDRIAALEQQATATAGDVSAEREAAKQREALLREELDAAHEEVQARVPRETSLILNPCLCTAQAAPHPFTPADCAPNCVLGHRSPKTSAAALFTAAAQRTARANCISA